MSFQVAIEYFLGDVCFFLCWFGRIL